MLLPLLETEMPSAMLTGAPVFGIDTPFTDHAYGGTPPDALIDPA
jgi:hypothetical protein